jgi:hypothetical protein
MTNSRAVLSEQEKELISRVRVKPNKQSASPPLALDLTKLLFNSIPMSKPISHSLIKDIFHGKYGNVDKTKVDWVQRLSIVAQSMVVRGDTVQTTVTFLKCCKNFYAWLRENGKSFELSQQHANYVAFAHHLEVRITNKEISNPFRNDLLVRTAAFVNSCVDSSRISDNDANVYRDLGLKSLKTSSRKYDKQLLTDTQTLAQALLDIYFSLSDEAIFGQLPISIVINKDKSTERSVTYTSSPAFAYKDLGSHGVYNRKRVESLAGRRLHSPTRVLKHDKRWVLVNLKRNVFFMMFIIASGANVKQIMSITNTDIKTVPSGANQTIFKFKNRAHHEVSINIYNAFKPLLKDYKAWRDKLFAGEFETPWLFPLFNYNCDVEDSSQPSLHSLKRLILKLGVPWQPPKIIRRTAVNWMQRNLGDLKLASDIAGHDIETFFRSYHVPNHQRAVAETQSFWEKFDPLSISVIGGNCSGEPIPIKNISSALAKPDCTIPSGCLFCEKHRDVDTSDYVWSLVSFRFLKLIEAGNSSLARDGTVYEPIDLIVNRITEKLEAFKVNKTKWVNDAIKRVENHDYHPNWVHLIDMTNGL